MMRDDLLVRQLVIRVGVGLCKVARVTVHVDAWTDASGDLGV